MAAEDYSIEVAMSLNASELKSGLADANRSIKEANSSFKASTAGLDKWQESAEGINAKISQLTTVLDANKQKESILNTQREKSVQVLNKLQQEYEDLAKSGEAEKDVLDDLKRRIEQQTKKVSDLTVKHNNQIAVTKTTEKELKKYKTQLENVESGTEGLEKATEQAVKDVDKLGDEAKDSGSKLDKLKSIGGGVAKGILGIAGAAAGAVTSFLALGPATRETRNNMAKLETGFETAGLTAEQSSETYQKLYGVLGDTGKATEATAMLGQMAKSQEDLDKWTTIATGTYATFGDSLPTEALMEASLETSKTGKITGGLADALNWAGVSEEEFQAKLDAATTEQERQKIITDQLTESYGKASEQFQETNADIIASQEADAKLAENMAELGAVAEPILTTLKESAADLLESFQPFIELFGEGFTEALNGAEGGTDKMATAVSGLIENLIETVEEMLPTIIQLVVDLAPKLISAILENLPSLLQTVIDGVVQIINGISEMLPTLIPLVIQTILDLVETILDNIDQLIDAGIELIMALADGLIEALPGLIDKIPVIIDKLISAFTTNMPKLIQMGIDLIIKLAAGLIKAIPQLISKIPEIIASLFNGFKEYAGSLMDIGKDLIDGLWKGISEGWEKLKKKAGELVGKIKGVFTGKDGLDTHSPSKWAEKLGLNVDEGLAQGLDKGSNKIKSSLNDVLKQTKDQLGNIKAGLVLDSNITGSGVNGGNSHVINNTYTQVINAPKQPNLGELYRRTGNLLDLKGGTA